jgi:hypothetical protein
MDPQIAAAGQKLCAAWTTAGTDAWGSGPIATALSADGGQTWVPGPNPADDGSTTGHGFIDLAADREGNFHLTWLDGRDGAQGLRYASSRDAGCTWSANVTLKTGTCECCANRLAVGAGGEVGILFRDKGPRDMAAALSRDGGQRWLAPMRVGAFGWNFEGCPHVGGGLAFAGDKLHAVVWTGQREHAGVHYLGSAQRGETWSPPRRLGDATASHPDLAAGSAGEVAAAWDSPAGEHSLIQAALSRDGGATWSTPARLSPPAANASHPLIVPTSAGFRVFWTERPEAKPALWRSAPLKPRES